MTASIGHYLLLSCIVFNALALVWQSKLDNFAFKKVLFCFACILPVIAFLLLEYAFIVSDFTLRIVFFHSSTSLPLTYKISSGWASHESSMLLWLSMLSLVSLSLIFVLKYLLQLQNLMITMASFVQLLFCTFILTTSSPFEELHVKATQGMGMNPMLQDMAIAIHPPILYTGFVSLFGIFLCSLLILQRPEFKRPLLLICRQYSSFALTMLTAGIGLGSWWAYRELGWGGFWYFDPVENISLLPWISCIILHHYLIFATNGGQFIRSTLFFGIFAFLTTLYGFFFIRSGIVSSVHSFAFSPEKGIYILIICMVLTVLSYLLFSLRIGQFSSYNNLLKIDTTIGPNNEWQKYQQQFLKYGNLLWIVAIFSLLIAIIYPIYYSIFRDLDIAIDPAYYHKIFVPLFIPILFLAGIAPCYRESNCIRNIFLLVIAILLTIPIIAIKNPGIIITFILIAAIFLIISSIEYLIRIAKIFNNQLETRHLAVFLGHLGAGLLALAICINIIFSTQINFLGNKNTKLSGEDLAATLDDISFAENDVYYRQIAKFTVQDANGNFISLKPENRLYKVENTVSQEADIFSFISHDLYAVITNVKNKVVNAEIYYKPMISFIWLAVLLMSLGFIASFLKKR